MEQGTNAKKSDTKIETLFWIYYKLWIKKYPFTQTQNLSQVYYFAIFYLESVALLSKIW